MIKTGSSLGDSVDALDNLVHPAHRRCAVIMVCRRGRGGFGIFRGPSECGWVGWRFFLSAMRQCTGKNLTTFKTSTSSGQACMCK